MDNMHHIARIDFEDEALKLIRAEAYDKRLVVMTQAQFETVFRSWMKPGEGQ